MLMLYDSAENSGNKKLDSAASRMVPETDQGGEKQPVPGSPDQVPLVPGCPVPHPETDAQL